MAHEYALHAGHCGVHRKEPQSLIKSNAAVCAVEAKDMAVAQAGQCLRTNLSVMLLSSTMVGGKESILSMRVATCVQCYTC